MKGRAALAVEWGDPPKDAFDSEAHFKRLDEASEQKGFDDAQGRTRRRASREAVRTIYASYYYPFYAHAPVETMNCVADVRDDRCIIWAPTQAPNALQEEVAKFLGMTPDKVEVNVTLMRRRIWAAARGRLRVGSGGDFPRRQSTGAGALDSDGRHASWPLSGSVRASPFRRFGFGGRAGGLATHQGGFAAQSRITRSGHRTGRGVLPGFVAGVFMMCRTRFPRSKRPTSRLICRCGTARGARSSAPSSVFAREAFIDEVAHVARQSIRSRFASNCSRARTR